MDVYANAPDFGEQPLAGLAPSADPDRACEHPDFVADVEINRLTKVDDGPVVGYSADIKVTCANCHEPFRWTGLAVGVSPAYPMRSVDGTVLVAPLRPSTSDPDFGLGLPGFTVTSKAGEA